MLKNNSEITYIITLHYVNVLAARPCASNPCQNGAECRDDPARNSYTCKCTLAFTGRDCNIGKC